MRSYKVYGKENTHLVLTEKGQAFFETASSLEIREYCNNGKYTYDIDGFIQGTKISEQEVIDLMDEMSFILKK